MMAVRHVALPAPLILERMLKSAQLQPSAPTCMPCNCRDCNQVPQGRCDGCRWDCRDFLDAMMKVDLLRFIPFRLNRLAAEVSRELAGVYSGQFGIDITEWRVLATLGMSEPRSAQFVVRCTRTHKSKISRAVTRLALAGLIEGVPNSDDRRETQLRLTKKGRALYEKLAPVVLNYEQRLLAGLTKDDLHGLIHGLDMLEKALGLVQDANECP